MNCPSCGLIENPPYTGDPPMCPRCGQQIEMCPNCGGSGLVSVTRTTAEHDPRCDGTCRVGCPIPVAVQDYEPCDCGGLEEGQ